MMTQFDYPLYGKTGENEPYFHAVLQEPATDFLDLGKEGLTQVRPAMIVLPGGAYTHLSPREAEPVALAYAAKGFNTFVLYYSLLPKKFPQPLLDVALTIKIIREHAKEWNIDPQRIGVVGFSAGGHLAGSIATCWNHEVLRQAGFDPKQVRPDAAILSYAAVASGKGEVLERFGDMFLGENIQNPLYASLASCPANVTEETCPCFLWQTANDPVVSVENTLVMSSALAAHKVPFEVHIFPDGPHGLSLATADTAIKGKEADFIRGDVAQWVSLSLHWLEKTWKFKI